eukprot:6189031-Pleurochrysis_carterae.AAC.2
MCVEGFGRAACVAPGIGGIGGRMPMGGMPIMGGIGGGPRGPPIALIGGGVGRSGGGTPEIAHEATRAQQSALCWPNRCAPAGMNACIECTLSRLSAYELSPWFGQGRRQMNACRRNDAPVSANMLRESTVDRAAACGVG